MNKVRSQFLENCKGCYNMIKCPVNYNISETKDNGSGKACEHWYFDIKPYVKDWLFENEMIDVFDYLL